MEKKYCHDCEFSLLLEAPALPECGITEDQSQLMCIFLPTWQCTPARHYCGQYKDKVDIPLTPVGGLIKGLGEG